MLGDCVKYRQSIVITNHQTVWIELLAEWCFGSVEFSFPVCDFLIITLRNFALNMKLFPLRISLNLHRKDQSRIAHFSHEIVKKESYEQSACSQISY